MSKFDGLKVFCATMVADRLALGEKVTAWMTENRSRLDIVDREVVQSSDDEFHCITIILYFRYKVIATASGAGAGKPRVAAGGAKR